MQGTGLTCRPIAVFGIIEDMKKLISIVAAAILAGCFTPGKSIDYPAPAAPEGFVLIDAYSVGRPKDYVKFHNAGTFQALEAQVMYHDPASKTWKAFGGVSLKGPGDTDTMKHSTSIGGGLRNLRYFAVKFADGRAHTFNLDGAHNDLHVQVMD